MIILSSRYSLWIKVMMKPKLYKEDSKEKVVTKILEVSFKYNWIR
jgi:hypothetical protein